MVCTPDLYYQEFKVEGPELRRWKHEGFERIDMYHDLMHDEKERTTPMKAEDFRSIESMTDQTRWGIHEVQTRNKAIKYRRDLVARAMEHVVKLDETGITDLMMQIEAEYERKYGENVAKKYTKTVL